MPRLVTVMHVAEQFAVHPNTVRGWIKEGLLPAIVTPTGRYRVNPIDVERLLETFAVPKPEPVAV